MKKPLAYVESNAFQIVTESTPSDPYQLPSGTRIGDAEISASGLTAPRTYTFQDKSGAVLLANRVFGDGFAAINVPEDFASVEEAMSYLSGCLFAPTATVAVIINNTSGFSIENYNLPNVSIITSATGNQSLGTSTSVASITGSSGNYFVTLNANLSSLFSVGDVIYLPGQSLAGTGTYQALAGIFVVTAKTTNTLTIQCKYNKTAPFPTLTLTGASIQKRTSLGSMPSAYIYGCVLNSIELVTNVITIDASKIGSSLILSLNNEVEYGTSTIKNSTIGMLTLYSSGSIYPFDIKQSHISQLKGAWSCNSAGLTISLDSTVILDANANNFCVMGNNAIGMLVEDSKVLWEGSAGCPISAKHNLTYDIRATGCGYVRATGILNSPVLNPVANTIGNGNALIRTL